jgi:hypothetical protein|tara:strand:+ start:1285 stop:1455 length:171 start_codon:yes stop_codon:yes gene_type:complete
MCVLLHVEQVYRKSDFLLVFAPVIFHFAIAGREKRPKLPRPARPPLAIALFLEPLL